MLSFTEQVKTQVESQIKVRDLSNLAVSIAPADFGSWHDVRYYMLHSNHTHHHNANSHTDAHVDSTELMSEAKSGLKARVEAELAAAADDKELETLRDRFAAEERAIEHSIDHQVHSFSAALVVEYNFLSK